MQPKKFAGIPLKPYHHWFSLDRLKLGVDNLRYDIHLSPGFIKATRKMALQVIGRISGVTDLPDFENGFNWYRGEKEYKGLCRDIISDAVKRAKVDNEYQVLFLAKTNEQFEFYYNANLFLVDAAGGQAKRLLPELPYEILQARWSKDGQAIFFTANMGVHVELFRVALADGSLQQLTDGQFVGGNAGCVECHTDPDAPRTRAHVTACRDCHPDLVVPCSMVPAPAEDSSYRAPGYYEAMHGICLECHDKEDRAAGEKLPKLALCGACHRDTPDRTPKRRTEEKR